MKKTLLIIALVSALCSCSQTTTPSANEHRTLWNKILSGLLNSDNESFRPLAWKLIPRGWCYQNMARGVPLYRETIESIDPTNLMVFPSKTDASVRQVEKFVSRVSPYMFMASVWIPNFNRACSVTARNQTAVNQARTACALERYRLAHGEYPPTLAELVPQFLDAIPHDVIGGQPPHYSRSGDGTFKLYSIGWDEMDHGGIAGADYVWPEK